MVKKNNKDQEILLLKSKIIDLENDYRRVLADYQNQERRFKESQAQIVSFASASLIEKLLNHLDSLETAQKHLNDKGLEIVLGGIINTLTQEGLEEIKSDNQLFDPTTMDCVELVPGDKDMVVETIYKGYLLSGKVLRPAKVKVGSGEQVIN